MCGDPYTAGHMVNVGKLSFAIAKVLGLDDELCHRIRQGGEVHDVGKYVVPAEILARSGKLDPVELSLIKRHPEAGAAVLKSAHLPPLLADIALSHHERLDGSGYPHQRKGEEISLAARIVAVADVVEAMAHLRPYRAALGLTAALDTISQGAGSLFDREVVEACHTVFSVGFSYDTMVRAAS